MLDSTKNNIFLKLNKMWAQESKKPFVSHLIHAYIPIDKVSRVIDWSLIPDNKDHRCVITKQNLLTVNDTNRNNALARASQKRQNHNNKFLAFRGQSTNTVMSFDALLAFNEWVDEKIIEGDVLITSTLHKTNLENKQ